MEDEPVTERPTHGVWRVGATRPGLLRRHGFTVLAVAVAAAAGLLLARMG